MRGSVRVETSSILDDDTTICILYIKSYSYMIESILGDLSVWLVLIAGICLFLIGGIKGVVGFGTGLFAVPVISQIFSPEIALGLLTITLWLGNVQLVAEDGIPYHLISEYRGHFIASTLGALVGYGLFTILPETWFYIVLGIYILGYLVARYLDRFPLPSLMEWPKSDLLSGGSGGAIMGAFLSGGPVYVSYYQSLDISKDEFTACLGFVTTLTMGVRLIPMYGAGEFSVGQTIVGFLLFIPLALGVSAGSRTRDYIPRGPFNRVVELLLLIVALNLFYEGIPPLL